MTSHYCHYTLGPETTRDFGSVLGWPLDTFWGPRNFMVTALSLAGV